MPRVCTPSIAEILNRGKLYFRITYPTPQGRKRELYSTRKKAAARLATVKADAERFGTAAGNITSEQRAESVGALHLLSGTGISLMEAARQALAEFERKKNGKPLADAAAAFIASRAEFSKKHRGATRRQTALALAAWTGRTTTDISPQDVGDFLSGLNRAPKTVSNFKKTISAFFAFCVHQGWMATNPASKIPMPKIPTAQAGTINASELRKLLAACDPAILPGVAIQAFCGLRGSEVQKLDWSAVNLAEGIITIGAGIAKTAARRVCPIPASAGAWLAPYAQESGIVFPAKSSARLFAKATRQAVPNWPANALRHSCISAKVALEKNLSKAAYESGNSPAIIQQHYNGLTTPTAAAAWFAVLPETPATVIQFTPKKTA